MKYHHFHRFFTHSIERGWDSGVAALHGVVPVGPLFSVLKCGRSATARLSSMTLSGGEFDWGGTSVKS